MKIDAGLTMKRMLSVAIVVVLLSALGGCAHETDDISKETLSETLDSKEALYESLEKDTEFRGPTGEGPVDGDGSIMIQSFYYEGDIYIPSGIRMDSDRLPVTGELIGELLVIDNTDWPDEDLEGTNLKAGMEVYKSTASEKVMYVRIKKNLWYEFVRYDPEKD